MSDSLQRDFQQTAARSELVRFTHETPETIMAKLIRTDRVHAAGNQSVDDLTNYRLSPAGELDHTRQAWGMVDPETEKVKSVIYVHLDEDNTRKNNVARILSSPTRSLQSPARGATFYSISGFEKDSARNLIKALHAELSPLGIRMSTLSPLRNFDLYLELCAKNEFLELPVQKKAEAVYAAIREMSVSTRAAMKAVNAGQVSAQEWNDAYKARFQSYVADFHIMSDAQAKQRVLDYLMLRVDPVQDLHMKEGATIDRINLRAGDPEGSCKVMVNFGYRNDSGVLWENLMTYRSTIVGLVSPTIMNETAYYDLRERHPIGVPRLSGTFDPTHP